MRYTKYPELKAELKELAKEIKDLKFWRKPKNRKGTGLRQWDVDCDLHHRRNEFRHKHIAYCMLRGRAYEEIERYCREAPDFDKIKFIRADHYVPKTLHISA